MMCDNKKDNINKESTNRNQQFKSALTDESKDDETADSAQLPAKSSGNIQVRWLCQSTNKDSFSQARLQLICFILDEWLTCLFITAASSFGTTHTICTHSKVDMFWAAVQAQEAMRHCCCCCCFLLLANSVLHPNWMRASAVAAAEEAVAAEWRSLASELRRAA